MINKSSMLVLLNTVQMYKWKLMLHMAAAVLVLECKFYENSFKVSTIWLACNYERASKGPNPNGSRFNAYEIKSKEALRRALTLAGVTEITPEGLGEHITIQVPAKGGRDYIVTQCRVTYMVNGNLTSMDAWSTLQVVAYVYLEYLYVNYTDSPPVLQYEPADLEGLGYRQIASYYSTKLIQLRNYVSDRIDENRSFTSDDGTTFQDIGTRIDSFLQINPASFRSSVIEKGVYKSRQTHVDLLDYRNYKNRNMYSINTKTYGLYKSYINRCDPKMVEVMLIPSVDENQGFCMSKAKTGIDYLAEYAVDVEEIAEKKQSDIKDRQSIVDHISISIDQANDLAEAEGTIQAIDLELRNISWQAAQIDTEYSRYKSKDYVTVEDNEVGPPTRMSFVRVVIIGATFTIVTAMTIMHNEKKRSAREGGK